MQDHEILLAWLTDLHYEEYYELFISAGYDMPTISRMTPEDLTAIGIKKPNHRKRLKSEITQLNIPDGLPSYIPVKYNPLSFNLPITVKWVSCFSSAIIDQNFKLFICLGNSGWMVTLYSITRIHQSVTTTRIFHNHKFRFDRYLSLATSPWK